MSLFNVNQPKKKRKRVVIARHFEAQILKSCLVRYSMLRNLQKQKGHLFFSKPSMNYATAYQQAMASFHFQHNYKQALGRRIMTKPCLFDGLWPLYVPPTFYCISCIFQMMMQYQINNNNNYFF